MTHDIGMRVVNFPFEMSLLFEESRVGGEDVRKFTAKNDD